MQLYSIMRLLEIQGHCIVEMKIQQLRGRQAVVLTLKRLRRRFECGRYGRKLERAHFS
ncbi:MAG: hypothetical protein QN198_08860 [Armatimonadota bacterium]|nr:hypothetical protein [Armatimonadota bacterium]MDR5703700.1 hypothetical protein [Armatimonadota bacterium]